ncbi:MAG: hypothetical protein RIR59_1671, partial [Pseudomonadota bacterium]
MALGPRLDLRQSQSLVMTPQLQQAIKLLALSNLEIEAFIAEELDRNPLLDTERDASDDAADATFAEDADIDFDDEGGDDAPGMVDLTRDTAIAAHDLPLDADLSSDVFHHDSAADGGPGLDGALGLNGATTAGFDDDGPDFDSFAAPGLS